MRGLLRLALLLILAGLSLQLYFVGRIALMVVTHPESTAFERSAVYSVATRTGSLKWRQEWVPYEDISDNLKKAVIASEDASFTEHEGVDIEALEKAWDKNSKADAKAEAQAQARAAASASANQRLRPSPSKLADKLVDKPADQLTGQKASPKTSKPAKAPKIIGGSTITQQLAKNLFLSGERTLLRKGQELVLTLLLERLLDKQRILEIYLNSVEWGEGVFGAEAAAQYYYRKPAALLTPYEAARLAVMLPRPKYFETRPNSGYLSSRASTIAARMGGVDIP